MATTLAEAVAITTRSLGAAGIDQPATDARILVLAAAGLDRLALIRDPDLMLDAAAEACLDGYIVRRVACEPVSRILGRREFWGLGLTVTPDVLDPRADTETVVEATLAALSGRRGEALCLLDLGTGSGAILAALLAELPQASGWAVDRSMAACLLAQANLDACGFGGRSLVIQGAWGTALPAGRFDAVVSNPPYIETAAIAGLAAEVVHHDPHLALDGGADGLDAYRAIARDLPRLLAPGGIAALEVGMGQDADVGQLMADGLVDVSTRRDLAGIVRVVSATRPLSTFRARSGI